MRFLIAFAVVLLLSSPVYAQSFPVAGKLYLSFESDSRISTQEVEEGQIFQIWLIAEIPQDGALGMSGLEGSIHFPPSIEFLGISWPVGADFGGSYSEPTNRTFITGLGTCHIGGASYAVANLFFKLTDAATDVEISLDDVSVGSAAHSSFNGLGPGWARQACGEPLPSTSMLVLFESPSTESSSLVLNASAVAIESSSFARVKSLY